MRLSHVYQADCLRCKDLGLHNETVTLCVSDLLLRVQELGLHNETVTLCVSDLLLRVQELGLHIVTVTLCVSGLLLRVQELGLHNNNNNVHLSCAHQRPERSHDTY